MIKRRAFTLVELLVVIAIIGMLSTVAVVTLDRSRVGARNTKRVADIKQLTTAFNLAYESTGSYPSPGGWCCMSGAVCLYSWSGFVANSTVDTAMIPTYLGSKPVDPAGGSRTIGGYLYDSSWGGGISNGFTFSAGPTLIYVLEGAYACPLGRIWTQNSSLTECIVALDQRF